MSQGRESNMKVSIIMPVFNGEKYIEYALKSIIDQTYKNIQLILVDGGSNDSTIEIVKKYADKIDLIISEKDDGMYDAINKGFSNSDGELMLWLNSDDYLFPNAIKTVVDLMEIFPEVSWVTGRKAYMDHTSRIRKVGVFGTVYRSLIKKGFYRGQGLGYIMQETTFWKRSLYDRAGGFINTNYKLASDYELWVRFSNYEILYSINTLLGAFRQHPTQLSSDNQGYEDECEQIKKLGLLKRFILLIKYPLYICAMMDKKNKIVINKSGTFEKVKWYGIFQ